MIKQYKIMTNRILLYLTDIEKQQRGRLASLKKYDNTLLKEKKRASGRRYYTSYKPKITKDQLKYKFRYVGNDSSETVLRIKEAHYLKKSLSVIGKDIRLLKLIRANWKKSRLLISTVCYLKSTEQTTYSRQCHLAGWLRNGKGRKRPIKPLLSLFALKN